MATVTPGNASLVGGLQEATKELSKGAKQAYPISIAAIIIAFFVFVLIVIGLMYIFLKKGPRVVKAEVYDPIKREKYTVNIMEIAPGVFATPDGRYIGLIPSDAVPVTVRDGKKISSRVIPTIKIGQMLVGYDPLKAFYINLTDTNETIPINKISDLIYYLYRHERQYKLKLAPNAELIVYYDGNKMADFIADAMGKDGEESITSIAGMTGKRKEFEAFVKTMVEMERKQAQIWSSAFVKVMIILLVVALVGGIVLAVLTHFNPGALGKAVTHTTTPQHTVHQAAKTITYTLPRG